MDTDCGCTRVIIGQISKNKIATKWHEFNQN